MAWEGEVEVLNFECGGWTAVVSGPKEGAKATKMEMMWQEPRGGRSRGEENFEERTCASLEEGATR